MLRCHFSNLAFGTTFSKGPYFKQTKPEGGKIPPSGFCFRAAFGGVGDRIGCALEDRLALFLTLIPLSHFLPFLFISSQHGRRLLSDLLP